MVNTVSRREGNTYWLFDKAKYVDRSEEPMLILCWGGLLLVGVYHDSGDVHWLKAWHRRVYSGTWPVYLMTSVGDVLFSINWAHAGLINCLRQWFTTCVDTSVVHFPINPADPGQHNVCMYCSGYTYTNIANMYWIYSTYIRSYGYCMCVHACAWLVCRWWVWGNVCVCVCVRVRVCVCAKCCLSFPPASPLPSPSKEWSRTCSECLTRCRRRRSGCAHQRH